jgi:DNA-binding transcriptional ArsR family regulator
MSVASAERLAILQLLRFKRRADAGTIAEGTGLPEDTVGPLLAELEAAGLIADKNGTFTTTEDGAAARDAALAAERDTRAAGELEARYARFAEHNDRLKQVVVDWQLREVDGEQVPNDHADPAYDAAVKRALAEHDAAFRPLLTEVIALVPRLDMYARRFDAALAALETDPRYVASPLLDSYHTVWFELHEELIGAQGVDRLAEESAH